MPPPRWPTRPAPERLKTLPVRVGQHTRWLPVQEIAYFVRIGLNIYKSGCKPLFMYVTRSFFYSIKTQLDDTRLAHRAKAGFNAPPF